MLIPYSCLAISYLTRYFLVSCLWATKKYMLIVFIAQDTGKYFFVYSPFNSIYYQIAFIETIQFILLRA